MPPGYQPPPSATTTAPDPEGRFIPGHLWGDSTLTETSPPVATSTVGSPTPTMETDPVPSPQEDDTKTDDASPSDGARDEEMSAEILGDEPTENRFFLGAPFIPTTTQGSPKMALNALYGKEMEVDIREDSYFYWNHRGQFTCVVVCPVTYEIFPAGRYQSMALTASGGDIGMTVDDTGIVWYSRKKEAAQGAAACRYDCWYYRQWLLSNPSAPKIRLFGLDDPYGSPEDDRPSKTLALIPPEIMESIQARIVAWKKAAQERKHAKEQEVVVEVESDAYRNAYLETRGGGGQNTNTGTGTGSDEAMDDDSPQMPGANIL